MKPAPKIIAISEKIYGKLLCLYPQEYRRDFGGQMAQLFRDQCRDAWDAGRFLGLLRLWLRTLPDLGKTSFIEQLNHLGRNYIMKYLKNTPTILMEAGLAMTLLSFSRFIMPFHGVFILLTIGSSLAILAKAAVELFRPASELPAILIRTFILMVFYAIILPAWAKLKMHASITTPVSHDPFGVMIMICLFANPVVAGIKLVQYFVHRLKS